jgi:hypothetical protein
MTLPVYYPHTYQAPNGQAFYAQPATSSYYLSITNNGKWTKFATTKTKRDFGTGAMYDIGKVIVIGGRNGNTIYRSAEIINLATSARDRTSPQWAYTGSMGCQRVFLNSTILPDGKVLVTGGIKVLNFDPVPNQDVCFSAEMWDPATGKFTTMASMTEPRWYHSVALLLPDGTVLVGGGNEHPTAEIYSPPYLFKGTRPTIDTYPTVAKYGQKFNITTSKPTDITKVTFLGLGSVTHGYNQSQRYMTLSYSRTSTGFTLTAPSSKNNAPPGYYLLFVLNKSGVPSEGKIIQLM